MPLREIIRIDEELCDGCGLCVPACAEGAIALVDGKARLLSERLCDGLGACLGHCPQGAITVERAEVVDFDGMAAARHRTTPAAAFAACPGSREASFEAEAPEGGDESRPSALRQWPVQLHLVSPAAPHFTGADVLLAADCVAYAVGDFHHDHLAGRALAIACPKLDVHQEIYLEKLVALIDDAKIASLTVMVMEVPCCGGLVRLAHAAAARAARPVPVRSLVVGVRGKILADATTSRSELPRACTTLPVR
ncbi:MAG TPA: 4Fe-4S binding protein [Thermoanaerobaculaceae bacterium]|jgi:NAD-dependent dihydropyrimidine dehydrogenase PreA subunit|nr:4Fe-4S binding protein [Thermoanaerobaculaceae bacterium]